MPNTESLKQLLLRLVDEGAITARFGTDDELMDVDVDYSAGKAITAWYIRDGEIIGEAAAGMEVSIAEAVDDSLSTLGFCTLRDHVFFTADQWARSSSEWDDMERELYRRHKEGGRPDPYDAAKESTIRDDIYNALKPEDV